MVGAYFYSSNMVRLSSSKSVHKHGSTQRVKSEVKPPIRDAKKKTFDPPWKHRCLVVAGIGSGKQTDDFASVSKHKETLNGLCGIARIYGDL